MRVVQIDSNRKNHVLSVFARVCLCGAGDGRRKTAHLAFRLPTITLTLLYESLQSIHELVGPPNFLPLLSEFAWAFWLEIYLIWLVQLTN